MVAESAGKRINMAEIVLELEKKDEIITGKAKPAGNKLVWMFPWLYRESFLIAFGFLIIGFALEIVSAGTGAQALHYPYNVTFGVFFVTTGIAAKLLFKKHPVIKWLASVPASISAIALVFFMVVLLGLIPQVENEHSNQLLKLLGLTHITSSWPFIMALLFLLATLLFAIFKRLYPLNLKNIAFFVNHAGLWFALFGGFLGAGDFRRLNMDLYTDEVVWKAYDQGRNEIEMPLALKLNKFDIDEYNPKLVMVNHHTWDFAPGVENQQFIIETANSGKIGNWEITVDKFHASAYQNGGVYEKSEMIGSGPAAFIRALNTVDGTVKEGWITSGSFVMNSRLIEIDEEFSIAMTIPDPKRYSSEATLYTFEGDVEQIVLEVNKPYSVAGWKIYQTSYDERFGRWSQLSVVELIKDPWLPVVYTGIFMMIAGAIYLMWVGRSES